MTIGREYAEAYKEAGSYAKVARRFGVNESTARRSAQHWLATEAADPGVRAGMDALGLDSLPAGGWIKSQDKDAHGRTYSFMIPRTEQEDGLDSMLERIETTLRETPAVKLRPPKLKARDPRQPETKGFIPLNDLHAGAYAWSEETGYGDWDLEIATTRLTSWVGELVDEMPVVDECILFYNGDTMHVNDGKGMTPLSGNILDRDSRFFKVADRTTAAIIVTGDLAAQKHRAVRIVVKKGNHDPEAYIAIVMGLKYRYIDTPNVTVEEDPSPYWAHSFGKVFLFGHHGDRVKPDELIMKMAADHKVAWGQCKYPYIWTAHLHSKSVLQKHGVIVERASCITEPDAHGAAWGNNAMATAVIYCAERGERKRFTVRA